MRLLCPAKINLHLRVGRLRADGFHPLLTWMTTVGFFDTLTVEPGLPSLEGLAGSFDGPPPGRERAGAARILLLSSDLPGLPVDESNLVMRAAEAFAAAIGGDGAGDVTRANAGPSGLAEWAGAKSGSKLLPQPAAGALRQYDRSAATAASPKGFAGEGAGPVGAAGRSARNDGAVARVMPASAVLEKRIPLGAGLGGGSSDAARMLMALDRLWQTHVSPSRLAEVAGRLGSDVPFFLHGPSSVCTGRGEIIRPIARPRARWAVLVLPDIHMPTATVYRRFDELSLGFDDAIAHEPDWEKWTAANAKELLPGLVNDLERPAFEIRPDLGTLRAGIEAKFMRPVRMSGSGSSLFTLFDDADEAASAAAKIAAHFSVRAFAVETSPMIADDLNAGGSEA